MNLSFLLLLLPAIYVDVPIQIIVSLLSLCFSSLLFHNINEYDGKIPFILAFDQINIINTCIMITFDSWSISLRFILLSLLERLFQRSGGFTCMMVYFFCFIMNFTNNTILILFLLNLSIYTITNLQNRDFTSLERYIWHGSQAVYITFGLLNTYDPRISILSGPMNKQQKKK